MSTLGAPSRVLCDFYVHQASQLVARFVNAILSAAEAQATANSLLKLYGGTHVCVVSKGATSGPPRAPIKSVLIQQPVDSTCWISAGTLPPGPLTEGLPLSPFASIPFSVRACFPERTDADWYGLSQAEKIELKSLADTLRRQGKCGVRSYGAAPQLQPLTITPAFSTSFFRPQRVAGVGAVRWLGEVSAVDVIEARAHLIAWANRDGVSPPLENYGKQETEFLNPTTWTERDGIMLHAFSFWWNKSYPNLEQLTLGDGPTITQAALTPKHLTAMRSLSQGGLPAGWTTPPWLSPNVTPQLAAQAWSCTLGCDKYTVGTTELAACLAACATAAGATPPPAVKPGDPIPAKTGPASCPADTVWDGTQCQPKLPPPPASKSATAADTKSSNTALWVVGGAAVLGAALLYSRSKSSLLENSMQPFRGSDVVVIEKRKRDGSLDFSSPQPPKDHAKFDEIYDWMFRDDPNAVGSWEHLSKWLKRRGWVLRKKTW